MLITRCCVPRTFLGTYKLLTDDFPIVQALMTYFIQPTGSLLVATNLTNDLIIHYTWICSAFNKLSENIFLLYFNSYYYSCGVRSLMGYSRILIPDREWDLLGHILVLKWGVQKGEYKRAEASRKFCNLDACVCFRTLIAKCWLILSK